jgi:hypothetical protein
MLPEACRDAQPGNAGAFHQRMPRDRGQSGTDAFAEGTSCTRAGPGLNCTHPKADGDIVFCCTPLVQPLLCSIAHASDGRVANRITPPPGPTDPPDRSARR